jgi:hypothetical protein
MAADPRTDETQGESPDRSIELVHRTDGDVETTSSVSEPAKLLRIGHMLRALQGELHREEVNAASRERLRQIHSTAVREIDATLSGALKDELGAFTLPLEEHDDPPTEAELRVAHAQLIGWLEGLFQGIQAAIASQQLEAHQQLSQMRGRPGGLPQTAGEAGREGRGTGQYL